MKKSLYYGYNQICVDGTSIHAEIDAMNKFIKNNNVKRKTRVNILVLRTMSDGRLKNSKPCRHCVLKMSNNKYLNIKNVYYSTENGEIICIKLKDLVGDIDSCVISGVFL